MNNVLNYQVTTFTQNVASLLQQKGSRLRGHVTEGSASGKLYEITNQVGPVVATKRTGRAQPLVPADVPSDRRWCSPTDYDWDTLVDNFDKLRLLIDPTSEYTMGAVNALGRAIDDEIITAFFGTALTGETGTTSTTFPSGQQVAINFGAAGNTSLTIEKLREAKRILLANEVDIANEELNLTVSAKEHDALLGQTQAISMDYQTKPVLEEGLITRFMGFNFIHTERLPLDSSGYRRLAAYAKSGMFLGVWSDITTSVDKRADLSSQPQQIYCKMTVGASRVEEKKIVEIKVTA